MVRCLLAAFVIAGVWVLYFRAVAGAHHVLAGVADAALIGLSGVVTLGYVEDRRRLPWVALAGGLGTWAASWIGR